MEHASYRACADVWLSLFCVLQKVEPHVGCVSLHTGICEVIYMIVSPFIMFSRIRNQPPVFLFHKGHMPELFKSPATSLQAYADK